MKKSILLLKIAMLFITAIWGVFLGVLVPLTMLLDPYEFIENIPTYVAVLWLATAAIGFIVPCFLVMLKFYKVAAGFVIGGSVALLVTGSFLSIYTISGFGLFYLPLHIDTIVIVMLAYFMNIGDIRIKRHQKRKAKKQKENAPAPSILGKGTYESIEKEEKEEKPKTKKRGKK